MFDLVLSHFIKGVFGEKGPENWGGVAKEGNIILQEADKKKERIASLARLIQKMGSAREICCCIYIDKESNVWYSTNSWRTTKLSEEASRDELVQSISFINDYIVGGSRENFLRNAFAFDGKPEKNETYKKYRKDLIKKEEEVNLMLQADSSVISENDKKILRLVKSELYDFQSGSLTGEQIFSHFKGLKESIHKYFRSLPKGEKRKTIDTIAPISLYIEDFLNIHDIKLEETMIVKAFKENSFKRVKCEKRGIGSLHCEQKMLEFISSKVDETKISDKVYYELKNALSEGRFVVSKLCCGYCYSVFSSLAKVTGEPSRSLDKLGNSACFYRGWVSPAFKTEEGIFKPLRSEIHDSLGKIQQTKKATYRPLIENSETEKLLNRIVVPHDLFE